MARKRKIRRRKITSVAPPGLEKDDVKPERKTSMQRNFVTVLVLAIAMMLGIVFRQGNTSSNGNFTTSAIVEDESDFNSPGGDATHDGPPIQVLSYEDFECKDPMILFNCM